MQPGSSIMPGKVNPVIPEVVNQTSFLVIGLDLTVTLAASAGQLQLNVMEPVITFALFTSIATMENAVNSLRVNCVQGITANAEHTRDMVLNSLGIITVLKPSLGYKQCAEIAREGYETGKSLHQIVVVERKLMTQEHWDEVFSFENLISAEVRAMNLAGRGAAQSMEKKMTLAIVLQFLVVLAAIWMGARSSGIGLGLWGAVGLLVLVAGFGINPTSPPIDVMLIILAVIMAASVMEAAGGIDFLVRIAERIIRANPKYVTIVAPLTTWTFTFVAGTGHIVYPLLPVIYETAHRSGIRPERPMAVATIASQQAITASPVAAATAAMIGLFAEKGMTQWGLPQILMVCVPATLTGVVAAAIVSMFVGKDLKDDPEYQARLAAGQIPAPQADTSRTPLKPGARLSAFIFLAGVALVVLFGFFPEPAPAARREKPAGHADRDRDPDDVGGRDHAAADQGACR
jgi:hypothetical protein